MISERKIDDTFPQSQFLIDSFSTPGRLDRGIIVHRGIVGSLDGGILLYVGENIPSSLIAIENNPRKRFLHNDKWLIN